MASLIKSEGCVRLAIPEIRHKWQFKYMQITSKAFIWVHSRSWKEVIHCSDQLVETDPGNMANKAFARFLFALLVVVVALETGKLRRLSFVIRWITNKSVGFSSTTGVKFGCRLFYERHRISFSVADLRLRALILVAYYFSFGLRSQRSVVVPSRGSDLFVFVKKSESIAWNFRNARSVCIKRRTHACDRSMNSIRPGNIQLLASRAWTGFRKRVIQADN